MVSLAELIGTSPGIAAVREHVERLARQVGSRRQPPILIQGETGTGKGLVARLLHASGPRAARPFVDVNCAAIPESLIESELFGYERGAFTDARQAKPGLFQLAHTGTIFLDEIGLLAETVQGKLLKVIEDRAVRRLGATRGEPVDIAILSASNEDLELAVRERRFRADLYHRLAVVKLVLPALRQRGEDVLLLAEHYLGAVSRDYGLPTHTFAPDARTALRRYPWPGNVRELRNAIERTALIAEGPMITAAMLGLPEIAGRSGPEVRPAPVAGVAEALPPYQVAHASGGRSDEQERAVLEEALRETDWNISRAAARLGITRNTIRYRIEKHGLHPDAIQPRRGGRRPAPVAAAQAPAPPTGAKPCAEERRLTFLRVRFTARIDSQVLTAGRIDETFVDKVETFGGRPEPVPDGDSVAVFGLEPVEDAPRRAVNAARAVEREVAREATGTITALVHVAPLPIYRRGEVADADAEATRQIAKALGEMMGDLPGPGIFVTGATAPFLQRRFDLGPVAPNLHRLGSAEHEGLGDSAGRLATFVGRQQELAFLAARFGAAAQGHGEVVGIAGAAGLGKSRLLLELRQRLAGSPAIFLEGHCLSHGSAMAYLPIRDVVRGALGIAEGDAPDEVEQRIRTALAELGLPDAEATPLLLHFLGLDDADTRVESPGPEVTRTRTFELLRGLLLALSRKQLLVIAIEDLHWIDRTSEDVLAALADGIAGAPILLVTTYRTGYQPAWMGRSYATQIGLQPLAPDDGARVVRSLLGEGAVEEPVIQAILERAEGNPFFLEELVREVREQGGRALSAAVPETVEAVLMARIDRLPFADRQLLQAAAVVGRTVPAFILEAVSDLRGAELRGALRRLLAAEFLYDQAAARDAGHVFSHGLTQEVTYQSLGAEDRCRLHARIADCLERLDPARQIDHVERLAHHCLRGRLWPKAVAYLRQAGHRALARSAYRESAACFEHALGALRELPEGREKLELGVDLRCELRTVLFPLGGHERILDELTTAEALAGRLGDRARLARVVAYLADGLRLRGDHESALACGQRALTIVADHGDLALQVALNNYMGQICYDLGQYGEARRFLAANVERLVGDLAQERLGLPFLSSVHSRTWLVLCLSEQGAFEEAMRRAREAVALAEAANHPFSLTSAFAGLGRVHLRRGHLDEAVPALERALELSTRWSIGLWAPILGSVLGYGYAMQGRLREGIPLLERAVEQQESLRQMTGHALRMASLGEAYLMDGQAAAASAMGARALALAREQKERGHEAYAIRLLAMVTADGDPGTALGHYQHALALADELGLGPLRARCLLGLGQLQIKQGDRQAAADALSAAVALMGEMDLGIWRLEAERALAAL